MRAILVCCVLTISSTTLLLQRVEGTEKVDFNRDIRPILSEKCFRCHGHDEDAREAGLRLDVADADEGPFHSRDGYHVIKPMDLAASAIWHRLSTDDEAESMPPKDSDLEPLTKEQRELFKQWILQGAEYQIHWAFVPLKKQAAPRTRDTAWATNRIDQFVKARLESKELHPEPRAEKRALVRRVTFDLTGLPPTRDEINRFLEDDSPNAYEKLVDRLITTPQYGEHMAKYWLDLVRFADTNGIHHDHYREMTPYRDWVIRSFNDNLSFDKFVIYQVAGDLFEQPTLDQQIASGFNRLHLVIDRGTAIPKESFTRNVIDRVTAVGTAFMGLTVGCSVCHDHKYDPITQKDFYQLFAFFNNIDSTPETPGQGVHAPFVRVPSPAERQRLKSIECQVFDASAEIKRLQMSLDKLTVDPDSADAATTEEGQALASRLKLANQELQSLMESKKQLESVVPVSLVMRERKDVRPTHILIRGAYDQNGEQVVRDTPAFLPPITSPGDVATRMDLARWLTAKEHPLTARVTVNRIWQQSTLR